MLGTQVKDRTWVCLTRHFISLAQWGEYIWWPLKGSSNPKGHDLKMKMSYRPFLFWSTWCDGSKRISVTTDSLQLRARPWERADKRWSWESRVRSNHKTRWWVPQTRTAFMVLKDHTEGVASDAWENGTRIARKLIFEWTNRAEKEEFSRGKYMPKYSNTTSTSFSSLETYSFPLGLILSPSHCFSNCPAMF